MNTKRAAVITQARTGSSRLPGKIFMRAGGRTLLDHHLHRLRASGLPIIVATTDRPQDDAVAAAAREQGFAVFRGSEADVLERYYCCALEHGLETIIRVCSDSPLIDGALIKEGFELYSSDPGEDTYLSTVVSRTYPVGFDFEIFSFAALEEAHRLAQDPEDREHVTPYLRRNESGKMRRRSFGRGEDASRFRLAVDTMEDFVAVSRLIETDGCDEKSAEEIIELLRRPSPAEGLQAVIFCDGLPGIGFGHLTRAAAFAEACLERNIGCKIIVDAERIPESFFPSCELSAKPWMGDPSLCVQLSAGADFIFFDSYRLSPEAIRTLESISAERLFVDDKELTGFAGGTILNASPAALLSDYPGRLAADLLLGPKFALLRRRFREPGAEREASEPRRVLITTGGSAFAPLTEEIVAALSAQFPNLELVAVVNAPLSSPPERCSVLLNPTPAQLFAAMRETDLAVCGGGQTLVELLSLRVPAISLCLAENQRGNTAGFEELGAAPCAGEIGSPGLVANLVEQVQTFFDPAERKRRMDIARSVVDGFGAYRALDTLLRKRLAKALVFRPVEQGDSEAVLALSNLPSVRAMSSDSRSIAKSEHDSWFAKKLDDTRSIFLIASADSKLLGQVRVQCGETEGIISTSVHPSARGAGLGTSLVRRGVEAARAEFPELRRITASVRKDNAASRRCFERCGFVMCAPEEDAEGGLLRYECDLRS